MLWIFFLMRQVFLNLHSTRKQLNSCFPLTSVHGVGQHWGLSPEKSPVTNLIQKFLVRSCPRVLISATAGQRQGKKEAKSVKVEKTWNLKNKQTNNHETKSKYPERRQVLGSSEMPFAIRHQSPRSQFIHDYLMWWSFAVHGSHPTASTGVE